MGLAAGLVLVLSGLIAAGGLVFALIGLPYLGVSAPGPSSTVREVLAGGPSWRDGIRPGQTVTALVEEDGTGSWRIETSDGVSVRASPAAAHLDELRSSVFAAALGLALVAMGVALIGRPDAAAAAALLGILLGGTPLVLGGDPVASSAAGAAPGIALGAYLVVFPAGRRLRVAVGAVALGAALAWLASRYLWVALFEPIDAARTPIFGLGIAWLSLAGGWPAQAMRASRSAGFPTRADVGALSMLAVATAVLFVAGASPVTLVLLVALVALLYRRWRRALSAALDRILLSEVRERSALVAIEEERARFARDLHDSPLQQLAGVIKQLERRRETAGEVERLRNVAAELRGMVLELRPAVLEDLGLAASLLALAEEPSDAAEVVTRFRNDTGYAREQRLPPDVELAAYRLVAESVSNARAHSGAAFVYIEGVVNPLYLDLAVRDDGCGFDKSAVRSAERLGHFGLATMQQRAHIVGASLSVDAAPGRGTTVHLAWRPG